MPPVNENPPKELESPNVLQAPMGEPLTIAPVADTLPTTHSAATALPQESNLPEQSPSQQFDGIRQYFDRLLDSGVTVLNREEENWLSAYIDPEQEDQRELVYRLAKELAWEKRPHALTSQLVNWVDTVDQNYEVAAQLSRERLDTFDDDAFDPMMSLDEVSELMNLQLAYEDYKEKIQHRDQDKKDQDKKDEAKQEAA
ncbi:hypothetical protein K449DRAFT_402483 [Hypoxylon sp. EC38]|nr:hypothetical protein K449DRAFT_402483 [Hypoxylon sp. EC38]